MRHLSVIALLALSTLAACNRADDRSAADIAAAATSAAPAAVAPASTSAAPVGMSEHAAPGEHTLFDAKAFAGVFTDAGTHVTFAPDGTYMLQAHAEGADAPAPSDGTWTLEPDQRHVRLDPNNKADEDRVYEIVSNDELRNDAGQVLRREATPY